MTTAYDAVFETALLGDQCFLELDNGDYHDLPTRRWRGEADSVDQLMLNRCSGPTLDIGCGPGRMTHALLARGFVAVGIDSSRTAVRMTNDRGGFALHRSVFDHVPGKSCWHHVLLADGNLGIGGDPRVLLDRVHQLLCRGGSAIVETYPPGTGLRSMRARIGSGPWFPWAHVGMEAIGELSSAASLRLNWMANRNGRWVAELIKE